MEAVQPVSPAKASNILHCVRNAGVPAKPNKRLHCLSLFVPVAEITLAYGLPHKLGNCRFSGKCAGVERIPEAVIKI